MSRLVADFGRCDRCGYRTRWEPAKGGRFLRCAGCGEKFPCRNPNCGHADCADARRGVQWKENLT